MSKNTHVRYTISSHYGRFERVVVDTLSDVAKVVNEKSAADAEIRKGMFGLVDGTADALYVRRLHNGWSTPISVHGEALTTRSRREPMPALTHG